MSVLQTIVNSPIIDRIGLTLLHSLWQGGAVLAVLSLLMYAMRKGSPTNRYAVASGAMFLLVAGPVLTFFLVGLPAATSNSLAAVPPNVSTAALPENIPATRADSIAQSDQYVTSPGTATPPPQKPAAFLYGYLPWVVAIWIVGVTSLSLWNLGGWIAMQQMRFLSTCSAGHDADRLLKTISRRLGIMRPVHVLSSTLARTPMVIGALKPVILVPASALTELSIAELESILAHELAHIYRHDFVVNLIQTIVETVLFYHPAAWIVSARIRQERENCCDDLALSVTRDRASYVRALAAVAAVRVSSLAPAASGGKVLPRLQRLVGVSEGGISRPSGWSAVAILLTVVVAAGLRADSKARVDENNANLASSADDIVWVRGHVVDPEGKPVAGANITTTAWPFRSPLSKGTSGADGAFAISLRKSQFGDTWNSWESTVVAATAPGFGPSWAKWNTGADASDLKLRLAIDDVPIEGRILDLEGRPVEGANVVVTAIRPKAVELNKLDIGRNDPSEAPGTAQPNLDGIVLGAAQSAITSAEGKFRFTGLGKDRTIEMIAVGGGIAQSYFEANTRPGPAQSKSFQSYIKVTETTYGSAFDFIASPARIVRGTVRDASTHQPLAGIVIKTSLVRMEAVTDANGHYELNGMRREGRVQLTAMPTEDQPYLMRDMTVRQPAGNDPMTIDFDLHRGVPISGKITDKVSGEPVQGMEVIYYPYLTNTMATKLPEFINTDVPTLFGRRYTHADGSFHIVGLPGQAVIATRGGKKAFRRGFGKELLQVPRNKNGGMQIVGRAAWTPNEFYSVTDVQIGDVQKDATVNIQCDPGITVHLNVVDRQGAAVTGATSLGHNERKGYEQLAGAGIDVAALGPGDTRTITINHKGLQIGKIVSLKPEDAPAGTLQVTLEPWSFVTGRLLDRDGQPMADAMLQGPLFEQNTTGTGADGRFKLLVLQGMNYRIRGIKGRIEFDTDVKDLKVSPGETRDLGDVRAKSYN